MLVVYVAVCGAEEKRIISTVAVASPKEADCCVASHHVHLGQKVALEHTIKTTANGQLVHTFCTYVRGNNSQQVAEDLGLQIFIL